MRDGKAVIFASPATVLDWSRRFQIVLDRHQRPETAASRMVESIPTLIGNPAGPHRAYTATRPRLREQHESRDAPPCTPVRPPRRRAAMAAR